MPAKLLMNERGERIQPRDRVIQFMVTPGDADLLVEVAEKLQFRSVSQFCAAIMERLIMGGFAPVAFFKVGLQIQLRAEDLKLEGRGFYWPFERMPAFSSEELFAVHPEPALPDEGLSKAAIKKALAETRKELIHA